MNDTTTATEKELIDSVEFKAVYINKDDERGFRFKVFINNESFDYSMGSGHFTSMLTSRGYPKRHLKPKDKSVLYDNSLGGWIHLPTLKGVMYSLLLDAQCGVETFPDFCDNFGYDTDSRKALETYLSCQENETKVRKALNNEQIEQFKVLLEDY